MIVLIPDHCLSIYFNFPILCNNNIPSAYATEFMPLKESDMLETVANVKTLLIEGSCSPIYCCHRVIAERSLCQHLESSMGDYKYLSWMHGVDRKICHEGH